VRIVLVEDETVVSFLIEDMLKELGCANIWHASGVRQAMAILRDRQPDAAVLDVNLAGEPGYPIAEHLESARIPFLFATGYGRHGIPRSMGREADHPEALPLRHPRHGARLAARALGGWTASRPFLSVAMARAPGLGWRRKCGCSTAAQ